jgi:hypothetical protein
MIILVDFLQPDFRFLLSFIATISWAFGSLYTKKKKLLLILILALGYKCWFQVSFFCRYWCNWNWVNLMSIPAISWWSIAYLVIIGSVLSLLPTSTCYKIFQEINSIYAYINLIVAVLLGALILEAYNGNCNWRRNNNFGLYMVNHSIKKPVGCYWKKFKTRLP